MNAYVFLLAITCEAAYQFEEINVGTVLFPPSDISKKRWSSKEIALLRARRHFQTLIPTPDMINTNEDFINSLLSYFTDSYSSIKSEAKDPETDSIMNAALSDAIGGYLKAWVLPITKFAYYGGTVSQEDATKLFQLYDEIKQSLGTNGSAWRSPNTNLLNSVSINIASLSPNTIEAGDPCDSLAFFEKTDTGLSIPVPNVNWNDYSASIFVPLKNQSLIPLQSSNSNSLMQYYDAATNCIQTSKIEDQTQFEVRFQNWLKSEILPHLNDEKFYPALGSVLSLVNKTRNLVDSVMDLYALTTPAINKTTFIGIPVNLSSKKMLVVVVIIILEVAWCIPALCFLLCRRMKKNKSNSVYVNVEKDTGNNGINLCCKSQTTQYTPTKSNFKATETVPKEFVTKHYNNVQTQISKQEGGLSLMMRKNVNIDARTSTISFDTSFGAGTKSNSSETGSNVATIVYERPIHPRHNSANKSSVNDVDTQKSSTSREVYSCVPDTNSANITNSLTLTSELEPTKTVTILNERNRVKKIAEIENEDKETQETEATIAIAKNSNKACNKTAKSASKHFKTTAVPVTKTESKIKSQKIGRDSKSRGGVKLSSGKPYLEITIDRPQRHVSVDFSQNQAHVSIPKQSKIPKRTFNTSAAQTLSVASKRIQSPSFSKGRSFIPQPKRQKTVDDIIIKNKKTSITGNNTLNMTL